jgi:large subunit ribosomal protein L15
VGRGIGCGKGKTCGKGHKGQHARAGGYHKVGFEGGQMPLQRRLPKSGFNSMKALLRQELPLSALNQLETADVSFASLKAAGLIRKSTQTVKIIASGELKKAVNVNDVLVTAGARTAIEALGGTVQAQAK